MLSGSSVSVCVSGYLREVAYLGAVQGWSLPPRYSGRERSMSSQLMGHWRGEEAAVGSNGEGEGIGIGGEVYAGWRLLNG